MNYSVAISESINSNLLKHLIRDDGQEDLCFALYAPSTGESRYSGVLKEVVFPEKGDRSIHGNVSFHANYFDRITRYALKEKLGICFIHSHPGAGWQGMSKDDIRAEKMLAPRVKAVTGLPLLGLTTGSDGAWSGRFWIKSAPQTYLRKWCISVRIVGKGFAPHFNNHLFPPPKIEKTFTRTVSAWGNQKQSILSRLKVGVVGLGSVGSQIAEALIKTGIGNIQLIDFDIIEEKNLDRLPRVGKQDIGRSKVEFYKSLLSYVSPRENINIEAFIGSISDEKIFKSALDCDIIFSCVDRPHPRYVLNQLAYANAIPVIDGGIDASINSKHDNIKQARWRATTIGPGRICLECFGQYSPEDVALDMSGFLGDPAYIENLPKEHFAKKGENVYAFSLAASSNMMLQFLSLVLQPRGVYYGSKEMNFTTGTIDSDFAFKCKETCLTPIILASGDVTNDVITQVTILNDK